MTFGSSEAKPERCHSVCVGIRFRNGEISMLTVPLITDDLAVSPKRLCLRNYSHLHSLDVADMAQNVDSDTIDVVRPRLQDGSKNG